jgi:peptidoglycan/LPS O-acetylase OafA/YrhL
MPGEGRLMGSWAVEISSNRMYRDLFWLLATLGPIALCGMLAVLVVPKYRRVAAVGLLSCTVGAALASATFHYNYALLIWGGHDSAIRSLDRSALFAGFAASSVVYGLALLVGATVAKIRRRRTEHQ